MANFTENDEICYVEENFLIFTTRTYTYNTHYTYKYEYILCMKKYIKAFLLLYNLNNLSSSDFYISHFLSCGCFDIFPYIWFRLVLRM